MLGLPGNSNLNLEHLLRATNHLKIAQNEFELAKRQLVQQAEPTIDALSVQRGSAGALL